VQNELLSGKVAGSLQHKGLNTGLWRRQPAPEALHIFKSRYGLLKLSPEFGIWCNN
jgi:hypothetical protein